MNPKIKTILKDVISIVALSTIVGVIAYTGVTEVNKREGDKPCETRKCFNILNERVIQIETAMECPNNSCDRFKGKDAAAMEERLRREFNERIDKLHKEKI